MPPDIEKYRRYVDHFDISEEKKIDLIHTVWRMMQSFVDRAFGIDSTQYATQEKALENRNKAKKLIQYSHQPEQNNTLSKTFKQER